MPQFLSDQLGKTFTLESGESRATSTRDIRIGKGAICELRDSLRQCGIASGAGVVVYDNTTIKVAKEPVEQQLAKMEGFDFRPVILEAEPGDCLHSYVEWVDDITGQMKETDRCALVVGSGTLNDLVKVAAFRRKIPYCCIATAPSMDGYVSSNAAIVVNHVKKSVYGNAPVSVIADTDIVSTAPREMTLAGIGDALAKFTSLADWYVCHITTAEGYSDLPREMLFEDLEALVEMLQQGDIESEEAIETIVRILMVSGLTMQIIGDSRPASGGEHRISHTFDMLGYIEAGRGPSLHGLQVALGVYALLKMYRKVLAHPDSVPKKIAPELLDPAYPEKRIQVWKEWGIDVSDAVNEKTARLKEIEAQLPRLFSGECFPVLKSFFRSFDKIVNLYDVLGLPKSVDAIGASREKYEFALRYGMDIRGRFIMADLCQSVGILDETIPQLLG